MAYTLSGVAAEIKWGYQPAATLKTWTLSGGTLTATIDQVDTFRVSQSPLTLVIRQSTYPLEGLQIQGGTLTARLSPLELPDVSLPICSA